ncbi:MAG: hypothetical protein JRI25_08770 [Deltaproteobacteria bacterium]|nr:hypothetical protein [Deltaproteobacteria bacterium]MBW2254673.1 hypothetical protein [Deltaproteobacteria bacterium]
MSRHIHIDNLRQTDPKTLEVLIQDAIRKPILQISPQTLTDLVALSELESLPKPLRRDLDVFAGRVSQEIADLPDGQVIREFLEALDEVDGAKVPDTIREYILRESTRDGRAPEGREHAQRLLVKWEALDPELVELSGIAPRIQQVEEEPPEEEHKATSKPKRKVKKRQEPENPELAKWLSTALLEKLTQYRDAGLAEAVLIAGIRKDAEHLYPTLMPWEINKILRTLQQAGQVRRTAGRWVRVGRFW